MDDAWSKVAAGGRVSDCDQLDQESDNGRFRPNVEPGSNDMSSLMASLKVVRDALLRVVSEARDHAGHVATTSVPVVQRNLDVSSRMEEQAAECGHDTDNAEQTASLRTALLGVRGPTSERDSFGFDEGACNACCYLGHERACYARRRCCELQLSLAELRIGSN